MGSRAFSADRVAQQGSETDAAIQAISSLVGSALPVPAAVEGRPTTILFDGRPETISFVGLSEGRSLRGGPYKIVFRRDGDDLVIEMTPPATGLKSTEPQPVRINVVVLSGVRGIHFSYFGRLNPVAAPIWRTEWLRAELLPDLVSIRVDFEDEKRNEPAVLIALRQG